MTDPIVTAAKADRDRRDTIKARLFDGLDPATALAAALDLLLVREEDVDGLRAEVQRLTSERDAANAEIQHMIAERDQARAEVARLRADVQFLADDRNAAASKASALAGALAEARRAAESHRQAACGLDRIAAAAGVADGGGVEARIVGAIADLRARGIQCACGEVRQ